MEDIIFNFQRMVVDNPDLEFNAESIPEKQRLGERRFTVFTFHVSEALILTVEDLKMMGMEFPRSVECLIDKTE